jgi:hypothetical protein
MIHESREVLSLFFTVSVHEQMPKKARGRPFEPKRAARCASRGCDERVRVHKARQLPSVLMAAVIKAGNVLERLQKIVAPRTKVSFVRRQRHSRATL